MLKSPLNFKQKAKEARQFVSLVLFAAANVCLKEHQMEQKRHEIDKDEQYI